MRGQTLTVTTHSPVYVERSIAVVQWFVKELQADAVAPTPLDFASPVKAVRALTDIDELSASKCEGTPVKYAPSKRSFMAVWGETRKKGVLPRPSTGCLVGSRDRGAVQSGHPFCDLRPKA